MRWSQRVGLWRSMLIYRANPIYQRGLRKFYSQFVTAGDLCFDIGAHVGGRIQIMLMLGARVVAVEPQPQCFAKLQSWYAGDDRVVLIEQAVGAESGTVDLLVSDRHPTVSSVSDEWVERVSRESAFASVSWNRRVSVPLTTLDELIAEHGVPKFCKIDVEGFEAAVLRGLSQPLPALSFEYLSIAMDAAEQCIERLQDLGDYQYNWSIGERQRLQAQHWLSGTEMIERLAVIANRASSGDIYARLSSSRETSVG